MISQEIVCSIINTTLRQAQLVDARFRLCWRMLTTMCSSNFLCLLLDETLGVGYSYHFFSPFEKFLRIKWLNSVVFLGLLLNEPILEFYLEPFRSIAQKGYFFKQLCTIFSGRIFHSNADRIFPACLLDCFSPLFFILFSYFILFLSFFVLLSKQKATSNFFQFPFNGYLYFIYFHKFLFSTMLFFYPCFFFFFLLCLSTLVFVVCCVHVCV